MWRAARVTLSYRASLYEFVHNTFTLSLFIFFFQNLIIMIDVLFIIHRYPSFSSSCFSLIYMYISCYTIFIYICREMSVDGIYNT